MGRGHGVAKDFVLSKFPRAEVYEFTRRDGKRGVIIDTGDPSKDITYLAASEEGDTDVRIAWSTAARMLKIRKATISQDKPPARATGPDRSMFTTE